MYEELKAAGRRLKKECEDLLTPCWKELATINVLGECLIHILPPRRFPYRFHDIQKPQVTARNLNWLI